MNIDEKIASCTQCVKKWDEYVSWLFLLKRAGMFDSNAVLVKEIENSKKELWRIHLDDESGLHEKKRLE